MKKENKNLNSYLPFSDHCLTPKFLSNDIAVNTFVRLIKESHNTYKDTTLFLSSFGTYKKPITEIILDMPGLTEDQKNKSIQAFKDLEKSPSKKKLEPQF